MKLACLIALIYIGGPVYAGKLAEEPMRGGYALAPSAGLLITATPNGPFKPWCSASLVQAKRILTAYHCITGMHSGDQMKVFFPYEGLRDVDLTATEPFCKQVDSSGIGVQTSGCSTETNDLVVLELSTSYRLLKPIMLGEQAWIGDGTTVRIAGFGINSNNIFHYGVRHEGDAVVSSCEDIRNFFVSVDSRLGRELCFQIDESDTSTSRIGPMDSGGPMSLLHGDNGESALVGLALGVEAARNKHGRVNIARYLNLTNPFYKSWLMEKVSPGVEDSGSLVTDVLIADSVRYLEPGGEAHFGLKIGNSSSLLLVTLNHEPGSPGYPHNLDIYLPDGLDASCERLSTVEVCRVDNPGPGPYAVRVEHGSSCQEAESCDEMIYGANYQLTAVAVYAEPPAIKAGAAGTDSE